MFSIKDSIPDALRSQVNTNLHAQAVMLAVLMRQQVFWHQSSDRNFLIEKHLQDSVSRKNLCSGASILDSAPTPFQLKVKESLHIEWERLSLDE